MGIRDEDVEEMGRRRIEMKDGINSDDDVSWAESWPRRMSPEAEAGVGAVKVGLSGVV